MSCTAGKIRHQEIEAILKDVLKYGNDTVNIRHIAKGLRDDMLKVSAHHQYDQAFRSFFEQSPWALKALLQDEHALLLEVFAFAISQKNGNDEPILSYRRGDQFKSLSYSTDASGPFWQFIAKSSHPVVILVADAEKLDIALLRQRLIELASANHFYHHHPIILNTESSAACEKVIGKLKHEENLTKHSPHHPSKAWPLPIFAVHGSYQGHKDHLSHAHHLDMTEHTAALEHILETSAPQRTTFSSPVCSSG